MALADRSAQEAQAREAPLARNVPLLLAMALVVVGLAGLLPLRLSTNTTSTSLSIRRLEQIRADWQAGNLQLENEVVALGALPRVEREARERLGMVPAKDGVKISVDADRLATPYVPSRFLPAASEEPPSPRPWWRNLLGLLPLP